MKRLIFLVALTLVVGASMASAAVTPCLGTNINNVIGQTFSCFGLTYSDFLVSTLNPPTGVTVGIDANNTGRNTTSGNVDIAFQFSGLTFPSMADIQLSYSVTGPTTGIDWQLLNTGQGGAVTLGEFVCPAASGGTNAGGCSDIQVAPLLLN